MCLPSPSLGRSLLISLIHVGLPTVWHIVFLVYKDFLNWLEQAAATDRFCKSLINDSPEFSGPVLAYFCIQLVVAITLYHLSKTSEFLEIPTSNPFLIQPKIVAHRYFSFFPNESKVDYV